MKKIICPECKRDFTGMSDVMCNAFYKNIERGYETCYDCSGKWIQEQEKKERNEQMNKKEVLAICRVCGHKFVNTTEGMCGNGNCYNCNIAMTEFDRLKKILIYKLKNGEF